jgi:UDP-glucose 6-dehydrogenase
VRNMTKPTIGIIGAGTVGQALIAAFEGHTDILVNDPQWGTRSTSLTTMAQSVLSALGEICRKPAFPANRLPVVCVKSTVPPDRIADAMRRWPEMRLVVCPEFLRQASPRDDMLNMVSLVLGGDPASCEVLLRLFKHHSNVVGPMRVSVLPDALGAAFLKYQENAFLATKVSFMNECFDVFSRSKSQTSWQQLQMAVHQDHERMGATHWSVPGPDGLRGWGGNCLPKDVSAFQKYAASVGTKTPLLDAVCNRNLADREHLSTSAKTDKTDSDAPLERDL